MNLKLLDAYKLIAELYAMGIDDEEEIIKLIVQKLGYSGDGAILAMASYVESQDEIKAFLKKNKPQKEELFAQKGE